MTDSNKPPTRFDPLENLLTPLVSVLLSATVSILLLLIARSSPSDLHLAVVRAAEATEPGLSCTGRETKPSEPKLIEEARPYFSRVVGIINRLGRLLQSSDRQIVYECRPADTIDPLDHAESSRTEVARLTSGAIRDLDAILAIYRGKPDSPQSILRNLQSLRSSLTRIAYAEGDFVGVRLVVWLTELATLALSLVYMLITFRAMRAALPEGREWFHWLGLVGTVVIVIVSLFILATRDFANAAYFLMLLMLIAVAYAKLLTPTLHESRDCGLRSFVRLLIWGASSYFIVLSAVAIPYYYAELSAGSFPFRMAKLNVATAFWAVSLLMFTYHLLRKEGRSPYRTFFGFAFLALGLGAPAAAVGYYYWFRSNRAGYPGNILYGFIFDTVQTRAAFIEIALPRLMISVPLIVIIFRRLRARIDDEKSISEFLAAKGDAKASVALELLPRFRVTLSRYGVLFPNSEACLQKIDSEATGTAATPDTLPTSAPQRGIAAGRMAVVIDLLKSTRPVNVLMALVLATVSYVSASQMFSFASYAMLLVSVTLAVSGSFIVNDVADRAIDRINNPKRPIAAGTVTPRLGFVVGVLLLSVAPLFARLVSPSLAILCLVVCIASIFYSFYLKSRNGIGANLLSALLTATLCFVGLDIANLSWLMVDISIAVFFAALAREIAKDVEDLPGDRLFRKSTLAIATGPSTATKTAILVACVQIAASYIPYALGEAGSAYFVGITIANIILLRSLSRAYMENAARVVQRAVKLSMALYLLTYVALLSPMVSYK